MRVRVWVGEDTKCVCMHRYTASMCTYVYTKGKGNAGTSVAFLLAMACCSSTDNRSKSCDDCGPSDAAFDKQAQQH